MGYYQGLNKKFETLNNTKTEPGFKKLFLAQFYLSQIATRNRTRWQIVSLNTLYMTFETLTKLADLINQLQLNVDESKTSGMDELGNQIEDKIYFIQEEIKKLSRYNSRLIPSSFQANKVRDLKSEFLQANTYTVFVYFL